MIDLELTETFIRRVSNILSAKDMSIRRLAIKANIPPSSLQSAFQRGKNITLEMAYAISKALNVDLIDLLPGNDLNYRFFDRACDIKTQMIDEAIAFGENEEVKSLSISDIQAILYMNSIFGERLETIRKLFIKLNEDGQSVAVERIEELTEIPRYRRRDIPELEEELTEIVKTNQES